MRNVDPVSLEVVGNYLVSAVREMNTTLRRTSYSTILRESMDCSTALFDPLGQMIGQADHVPSHQGSLAKAARMVAEEIPLDPEDVIVFHDDLDLAPGKVRVKRSGGHGGHNGLRSIDAHMGKDYRRVRLGIGHPGDKDRVTGHVLRDFSNADRDWLEPLLDAVADAAPMLIEGDDTGFMTKVAMATRPPKPDKADDA